MFLHFVTLRPNIYLTFDLIFIDGLMGEVSRWTILVPSLVILVSVVWVLSCGQTDRQTESHTDATHRLTHSTVAGVRE